MDFKKSLTSFRTQLNKAVKLGKDIKFKNASKVLICGMGGSALPGDFLKSLFHPLSFEITVCKEYNIPDYVNDDYLCFCISYSGNTEETISMFNKVREKSSNIVIITSNGELNKLGKKYNIPVIKVPTGLQPRMAIGYQTLPVINVLINSGLINYDLETEVNKTNLVLNYDFEKNGKRLAEEVKGSTPLIYASTSNKIIAEKWKISFNENSKTPSFYNVFPEWNHNEINGFNNTSNEFTIIMLKHDCDNERVKKRFKIIKTLLEDKGFKVLNITLQGRSKISRLFWGILLGDWTSYELASLYKQDAEKVPIVESLKKELKK